MYLEFKDTFHYFNGHLERWHTDKPYYKEDENCVVIEDNYISYD